MGRSINPVTSQAEQVTNNIRKEILAKNNTERGFSAEKKRAVLSAEASIRNNRDESTYAFSPEGKKIWTNQGKGASVTLDSRHVPPGSVVTHNHPLGIGKTGYAAIGNSFSTADMKAMVLLRLGEMRAATPTYTFSMRPGKKGVGTLTGFNRANRNAIAKIGEKYAPYVKNKDGSTNKERMARFNTVVNHLVNKEIAKQMGWEYTRKRFK